jgi:hypothetical protein
MTATLQIWINFITNPPTYYMPSSGAHHRVFNRRLPLRALVRLHHVARSLECLLFLACLMHT